MLRKYMNTFALLCVVSPVAALGAFDKYEGIEVLEIVEGKFYTGKGADSDGNALYFGLERVEGNNKEGWSAYAKNLKQLTQSLCCKIDQSLPEKKKELFEVKGLSDKEIKEFQESYSKRRKIAGKSPMKFEYLEKGVEQTLNAFSFQDNDFIGYISDEPVTDYFVHPSKGTVRDFYVTYQPLLMVMRSASIAETPVFNNGTVIENPVRMLSFTYGDLSLKFHGFTTDVFAKFFNKTHLSFSVLPSMYNQLDKAFGGRKDQFYAEGDIPKELGHFRGGVGWDYTNCVLSVDALISSSLFKSLIWINKRLWRSQDEKRVTDIGFRFK